MYKPTGSLNTVLPSWRRGRRTRRCTVRIAVRRREPAVPRNLPFQVVELPEFRRVASRMLSREERRQLRRALRNDPYIGSLDASIKDELVFVLHFKESWVRYFVRADERLVVLEAITKERPGSGTPASIRRFAREIATRGAATALVEAIKRLIGLEDDQQIVLTRAHVLQLNGKATPPRGPLHPGHFDPRRLAAGNLLSNVTTVRRSLWQHGIETLQDGHLIPNCRRFDRFEGKARLLVPSLCRHLSNLLDDSRLTLGASLH